MKRFVLAALVAAGFFGSVGTADAQYRMRRGVVYSSYPSYSYSVPSYGYSSYSYPSYSYPTYSSSGVITSSYAAPTYIDSGVIQTSYSSPWVGSTYSYPYSSNVYSTPYSSFYNSYPYSGYNMYNPAFSPGLNITPSGGYYNGIRLWRR
jgi:hypothetical protein